MEDIQMENIFEPLDSEVNLCNVHETLSYQIYPELPPIAISVIIPMYNVEKYVGECLNSLLAQTFQDFEVIVVDDCSTDNSVKVVKSYAPKFKGRLTVARMEKNSGGAGFPRNKGIELAHGEYLYFVDPDDTITPTAFEELYTEAKNFDADVVHSEKWYQIPDEFYNDPEYRKKIRPYTWLTKEKRFITQPTLLTNDLEKRITDFCKRWLVWSSCLQMVRREFILKINLRFENIYSEDMIFTMCEICCAQNYLVVPSVFYLYRLREGSAVREAFDPPKMIQKYISTFMRGLNYLDKFLSNNEAFSRKPDLKYALFNMFIFEIMPRLDRVYNEIPLNEIDKLLIKEFDSNGIFSAYMFNTLNIHRRQPRPKQKLISVIIPMYNAEKYVGECLNSLLEQTFQDFEVIVVDDCSTDNSVEVVKGYAPNFQGRLTLTKTEKNTGSPGEPTNIGIAFSRGEYLFILDNDDTVTPDALEKLYADAKNFNADVVACEKYYYVPEKSWNDVEYRKNLEPVCYGTITPVKEPTLIPFDIARRVQDCYDLKFLWPLWSKLIRRDFWIENDIRLTNNIAADMLGTCSLAYTAKRFVRVPYAVNYYRVREDSLYHQERKPLQQLKVYLNSLKVGFKYLDDFLSKREFFRQNLQIKHIALNTWLNDRWDSYIREIYDQVPPHEREAALREEFSGDDTAALTEFFFNAMANSGNSNLYKEAQIINKFKLYFTARLYIGLVPQNVTGDFQILSVSDDTAIVSKPDWLQKGGSIRYLMQSYAGKLEIVAKPDTDGQFVIALMGEDVRKPDDRSTFIPYWIDYTKLMINGKTIFDKIIPVWVKKPYRYKTNVKAGAEIKIQVEWLPHRSDT